MWSHDEQQQQRGPARGGGGGGRGRGRRGNYDNQRGGGRGRGGEQQQSDRRRALFNRLLRDSDAEMSRRHQALRFLEGMDTFDSKSQLLSMMMDDRNCGLQCVENLVGFLSSVQDVEDVLVPLLQHGINKDMNKPFYRELRDRYLSMIFRVPMLLSFLNRNDVTAELGSASAEIVGTFLLCIAKALVEARKNPEVAAIATKLRERGDVAGVSETLCLVLLVDEGDSSPASTAATRKRLRQPDDSVTTNNPPQKGVCWATDIVPPGDRHDNDHLNYRNIGIVPTAEELRCQTPPYLPLASGDNKVIEDPVARLLDSQFRLLREDSINSMRQGIAERKTPWYNARVIDLDLKAAHSISFVVQVDPPTRKVMDWNRAKILLHGSIIALLDKNDGRLIRTGSISIRNEEWLSKMEGPAFGVEFDGMESFDAAFEEMATNKASNEHYTNALSTGNQAGTQRFLERMATYELVEVSKSFFSYKSVLRALQQMDRIPFSDELLSATTASEGSPSEYFGDEVVFPDDKNFKRHRCVLSELSTADMAAHTSLDESQAQAIRHALTSRVSLIQGPPGTGTCSLRLH